MVITAGLCLYAVTPFGLGTSPDSIGYLKGAEGLIDGHGLNYFNPQWPPLYPLLIALFSLIFDVGVTDSARLLNSFLVGLIIYIISSFGCQSKRFLWITFSVLVCMHPLMTHIYFYAWSETLLFVIILINFKYLEKIIKLNKKDRKDYILVNIVLIVCVTLASMTRYAGVTLLISNTITMLFVSKKTQMVSRLKLVSLHIIACCTIVSIWFIYTFLNFKTFTNRSIKLHPPSIEQIENALIGMGKWYFPEYFQFSDIFYIFIGASLIVYINRNIFITNAKEGVEKSKKNQEISRLIYSIFSMIYLLFIFASLSFIDIAIPLDNRILSPVFLSISICLANELIIKTNKIYIKYLLVIYVLIMIFSSLIDLKSWSMLSKYNGIELSGKEHKMNEINQLLKECGNIKIISDKPWELEMFTKAKVDWLPRKFDMTSGVINEEYKNQILNLSNVYSMIIVRDLKSEYIKEISDIDKYIPIHFDKDGLLWVNKNMSEHSLCKINLKKYLHK